MCHLIYCSTSIMLISIFYTDIWTFSLVKQLENKPNELLWQAYAFDFMVLGAVHKWHHQFFEISLPPQLPTLAFRVSLNGLTLDFDMEIKNS